MDDFLTISYDVPVPAEIRQFCLVSGIDLHDYLCFLLNVSCINHLLDNHSIMLNFYNSDSDTFISLFNEKE